MLSNSKQYFSKNLNVSVKGLARSPQLTPSQTLLLTIMETESCSLKALAQRIGIPVKTTENLLSGKTQDPHVLTFHKIFFVYCQVYLKRCEKEKGVCN